MIAATTHAVTSARARIAQGPSPRDARWPLLDRFPSHWFVLAYSYPSGSGMTGYAAGIAARLRDLRLGAFAVLHHHRAGLRMLVPGIANFEGRSPEIGS